MNRLHKILLALSIAAIVSAQKPSTIAEPQYRYPEQQISQVPPQQYFQQWTNNHNGNQWGSTNTGQNQPGLMNKGILPSLQHQRDANLVDYPFTVEFVDRRRQAKPLGTSSIAQTGIGAFSKSKHNDENLIDYPFTVEFRNNIPMKHPFENPESRGQASLHLNPELFQLTEQQRYQQNYHHQNVHANHRRTNGGDGGGW